MTTNALIASPVTAHDPKANICPACGLDVDAARRWLKDPNPENAYLALHALSNHAICGARLSREIPL